MSEIPSTEPRSVLVTGGNRGIGRAIAEAFVAQGDKVAVTTRNGGAPEGALGVRCDVTDPDAVDAAFTQVEEAHGPVEVLVANAGITKDTLLMRMSDEDFARSSTPTSPAPSGCARRAAKGMIRLRARPDHPHLLRRRALGSAGQANYAASKAGLVGLARSITRELGGRGITANVVAPGFIETDMTAVLPEDAEGLSRRRSRSAASPRRTRSPRPSPPRLRRRGYVTGAVIPVDGGLGMGH